MSWQKKKMLTDRNLCKEILGPTQLTLPTVEEVSEPDAPPSIVFNIGAVDPPNEPNEILKISQDGFYVRGVKVTQDDKEAEVVYNAFKEFLVYHSLSRSYK